ncbi:YafY family transcriptional regulator [Sulfitobacter albidus]|uniref:YafY family transcriptional regulator n=1 Tax=Sulfitobacter albidus TaxID=2829501 RepID=A0A975JGQ7_9RHOB|nr:YafY family protein [Sulfitobacter albidus]QUJ77891.1 YafY family transcriptional regulator [Sulfitobacter albidus]
MPRADRLYQIMQILRDARVHTAEELADRLGVSMRTLYRDMERLVDAGFEVEAIRGTGYRAGKLTHLPPVSLTEKELEALNLGLAIAAELADPTLKSAIASLNGKLDKALPQALADAAQARTLMATPFSDTARGFAFLAPLRAALAARQKLRITYTDTTGAVTTRTVHPLEVSYWGRIWSLHAWCETTQAQQTFRLDLMQSATPLAELFDPPATSARS